MTRRKLLIILSSAAFENMYLQLRFPSPELGRIMTDIAANIDRKLWRMG